MDLHRHRFHSVWRFTAAAGAVFDVLADLDGYPRWWPQVRTVERVDADTAIVTCRSALPYTLRLRLTRTAQDAAAGILVARVEGDLDGWSGWTVRREGSGTAAVFQQEVVTRRALLRRLAPLVRPVLRVNHAWMMRSGRWGLARALSDSGAPRPA